MAMHNECQFVGNLVKDGEYRVTPNGKKVYKFTVAVFKNYKKDQNNNIIMENGFPAKESEYINVCAFGTAADTLVDKKNDSLAKGAQVMVRVKFNGVRTFNNSENQVVPIADWLLESAYNVEVLTKSKNGRSDSQGQQPNQQNGNYPQNGANQTGNYPPNNFQQGNFQQDGYQQGNFQQGGYQQGNFQQDNFQQGNYPGNY